MSSSRNPVLSRLRELLSAGAVVRSTLHDGLLRRIATENVEEIAWGQILAQFSAAGEQMDILWNAIDPSLSFYVPVPIKPTAEHGDGKNIAFKK